MKDLEIETIRSHEMRDGELVTSTVRQGKNGAHRYVRVITEETGISQDEIDNVLNVEVPKTLTRVDFDISKKSTELSNLQAELDDVESDPEFDDFIIFNNTPLTGVLFELKKLSDEAKEFIKLSDNADYNIFEEYISGDKITKFSATLKKMDKINQTQVQLDGTIDDRNEILKWKKQFEEINETLKTNKK